ncbi:CRISPR-associated protein Csd1 [Nocardia goodfellowii]|uniref:CRISPR-associated protein Csd1 n=1 Tax=Nocardia goodfellowii TaxID=882446 RepID=A0ABS4QJ57_9NOCA|nr:CRISPR-associated protein Csd1 [Nocardia goodfellowii]
MAQSYRSGLLSEVVRPEELRAKDGVVIAIDGDYAYTSSSAAEFWRERVGATKGSGRTGTCMICTRNRELANTIPGKVSATLVPGASNDAALVSINERVFGYDLVAQLTHTPICLSCADELMVGLTGVLSSQHTLTYAGQDTRLAWWVTDTDELDHMNLILDPSPAEVDAFFSSVTAAKHRQKRLEGRFCWLAVGGNVARIMVRDWVDIALACDDEDSIDHDSNVLAWFRDHKNTPRRTEAVTLRDGRQLPAGKWFHSPAALAACLGRWDATARTYRPFGAKNADRPDRALQQLMRVAVLDEPLPAALNAHLIHRIRSDGYIDDRRASLARLALTRLPNRCKDNMIPSELDEEYRDRAYLSGRLFALLEQTQHAAHRRAVRESAGTVGGSGESSAQENAKQADRPRTEVAVNSTFGDRFRRRAVDTPRPVLVQGWKESAAWLTKIRRRDGVGLAKWHADRIGAVYELINAQDGGLPVRNNLRQQDQFILGYQHQHAHRTATVIAVEA